MKRFIPLVFIFSIFFSNPTSLGWAHSGHKHDALKIKLPEVVAKVNDHNIKSDIIIRELKKAAAKYKKRGMPLTADQEKSAAKTLIDDEIGRTLLVLKAKELGTKVSEKMLLARLAKVKAKFKSDAVFEHRLADWALSRTDRFDDPADLAADYLATRAHASWVEGAHELMARAVLFEDEAGGGWRLKCPRELESSIYLAAMTMNLWPSHDAFGGPVKLIAADPKAKGAPGPAFANRALAEDFGYAYEAIPETGHLLQIQKPEECRRSMLSFLAEKGVE